MDDQLKFTKSVYLLPIFSVLLLWVIYWLDVRFQLHFTENGIYPRTVSGLQGVVFSVFIHESLEHLYNNSLPLLILLAALQYFYNRLTIRVLVFGIIFSGIFTWFIGRNSYHIGASNVVYVLVSFMFFKGIQTKFYRLVALSLLIIIAYGGLIWYVFPTPDTTISWEGHLGGFIVGTLLSVFLKMPEYENEVLFEWQKSNYNPVGDKFMERFDDSGNFINLPTTEDIQPIETEVVKITYDFKENIK